MSRRQNATSAASSPATTGRPRAAASTAQSARASATGNGFALVGCATVTAAASQPASAQRSPASRRTSPQTASAAVASAATRSSRHHATDGSNSHDSPATTTGCPGP